MKYLTQSNLNNANAIGPPLSLDDCGLNIDNEDVGKHRDLIIKPAAMAGLTLLLYASLGGRLDGLERRIDALHSDVRMLIEAHLPPTEHQHSNGD